MGQPPPPPFPPAPPAEEVQVEVGFHEALSPYGHWVWVEPYGEVWTPMEVPVGWRPYTEGRWVFTEDFGWTWVSDYEWGWAPFHYGRWFFEPGYGWCWVPGPVWAPAWVAWRSGEGFVGWAPLPPGVGLELATVQLQTIEPSSWCFIPEPAIVEVHLHSHLVPVARNVTLVQVTRNTTNLVVVDHRIMNRSIDVARIERSLNRPVPRFQVVERRSLAQLEHFGGVG
jgi:hypothetical protein